MSIPHQYDEKETLRLIASGNETAFDVVFQKYRNKVFYIGWKILKSDAAAEDILQDVFAKVWSFRHKLPDIHDFNAYLNTITRNHIFNQLRKQANEELFLEELVRDGADTQQNGFNTLALNELQRNLRNAVAQLPPQQKKVFQLSRMHGLKHEEIAEYMKISTGTVKKHMVVSLRHVRNYLSAEGRIVLLLFSLGAVFL